MKVSRLNYFLTLVQINVFNTGNTYFFLKRHEYILYLQIGNFIRYQNICNVLLYIFNTSFVLYSLIHTTYTYVMRRHGFELLRVEERGCVQEYILSSNEARDDEVSSCRRLLPPSRGKKTGELANRTPILSIFFSFSEFFFFKDFS